MKKRLFVLALSLMWLQMPCHAADGEKPTVSDSAYARNTKVLGEAPAPGMPNYGQSTGSSMSEASEYTSAEPMEAADQTDAVVRKALNGK